MFWSIQNIFSCDFHVWWCQIPSIGQLVSHDFSRSTVTVVEFFSYRKNRYFAKPFKIELKQPICCAGKISKSVLVTAGPTKSSFRFCSVSFWAVFQRWCAWFSDGLSSKPCYFRVGVPKIDSDIFPAQQIYYYD